MTQELASIPASLLDRLSGLNSVDEVKQMLMSMTATREIAIITPQKSEANKLYDQLYQEFSHLENSTITRQAAAKKYQVSVETVAVWEKKGFVRHTSAKRRGLDAYVNERDTATLAGVSQKLRTKTGGPIPGFRPPILQQ
jgi:hypothetical protein